MIIPDPVAAWCKEKRFGKITKAQSASGGCINEGKRIFTASGASFFLKQNSSAPIEMFQREAEGLRALNVPDGPKVPQALLIGRDFLLLEDLRPAARSSRYWEDFGHQLACLHKHANPAFGFDHDNFIGSTPQPNTWTKDGYQFFSQLRLIHQASLAHAKGLLNAKDVARVESLASKLADIIPAQPASLMHGDLWTGNAMTNAAGGPSIIDPAAHYGWAEAELGMTTLFGSFPAAFYDAYVEVNPLESNWRARLPLYNLYHILNHLNLFGRDYYRQALAILDRYS